MTRRFELDRRRLLLGGAALAGWSVLPHRALAPAARTAASTWLDITPPCLQP